MLPTFKRVCAMSAKRYSKKMFKKEDYCAFVLAHVDFEQDFGKSTFRYIGALCMN